MKQTVIAGIDPGITGAVSFVEAPSCRVIAACSMPQIQATRKLGGRLGVDWHQLACLLRDVEPDLAVLEMQGVRPGHGVVSSGKIIGNFYGVRAVLASLSIDWQEVPPATWKADLGLAQPKSSQSEKKKISMAFANALWPDASSLWPLHGHHGRAEAALIAFWKARCADYDNIPLRLDEPRHRKSGATRQGYDLHTLPPDRGLAVGRPPRGGYSGDTESAGASR